MALVFEADGDADEAVAQAARAALVRRHVAAPHGRGVDDERLVPAEAGGVGGEPQAGDEALGVFIIAAQLRREHPRKSRHLRARERVLRVAVESRIIDALDLRVLFEEARQRQRVRVVSPDAKAQCAQAAQDEPAVEGTQYGAGEQGEAPRALYKF